VGAGGPPGEGGGAEVDDVGGVAQRHGGVAVLLDGIEGGPELRHLRSGSQAATLARPGLAERRRFAGDRLEPSLTLRKIGRRNRLTFQLQEGHPLGLADTKAEDEPREKPWLRNL